MPNTQEANGRIYPIDIYGGIDPLTLNISNQLVERITNAYQWRNDLRRNATDPRRSIEDECGYPSDPDRVSPEEYESMWKRSEIAAKVVEVLAKETWSISPEIVEDEDPGIETDFERAYKDLCQSLRGQQSWSKGNKGNPLVEKWERVDKLSGIGQYGALLFGLDDEAARMNRLDVPAEQGKGGQLLYVRCLSEVRCKIAKTVDSYTDPRYGQPEIYAVQLGASVDAYERVSTTNVHWTRIIHIADTQHTPTESDVVAVPRLKPVWNRILDLYKMYGADAEAVWKNCMTMLFLSTHPQLGGDVAADDEDLRDLMENMMNGLQRWAALYGFDAKSIAPQVVDVASHIEKHIEAICIKLDIPKRIFMGSERGELASGQDADAWEDRMRGRRNNYVTPSIVEPTLDRLIWLGLLPEPSDGYDVFWADRDFISATDKADVAFKRTQSLGTYVSQGIEAVMELMDYLTRELGYTPEEAEAIIEARNEALREEEAEAEEDDDITPVPPVPDDEFEQQQNPFLEEDN